MGCEREIIDVDKFITWGNKLNLSNNIDLESEARKGLIKR